MSLREDSFSFGEYFVSPHTTRFLTPGAATAARQRYYDADFSWVPLAPLRWTVQKCYPTFLTALVRMESCGGHLSRFFGLESGECIVEGSCDRGENRGHLYRTDEACSDEEEEDAVREMEERCGDACGVSEGGVAVRGVGRCSSVRVRSVGGSRGGDLRADDSDGRSNDHEKTRLLPLPRAFPIDELPEEVLE